MAGQPNPNDRLARFVFQRHNALSLFARPMIFLLPRGGPMPGKTTRMTVPKFSANKNQGRRITMLTAYDFPIARLLDEAGVDAILVGDSLSMVVQGHANTLHVTLDEIIYHAEIVGRAVQQALVVVDMPFPSYHLGISSAIGNAARIIKETTCQAVKLEGGADQAETIAALVQAGIPVMAHVGLRPQNVHNMGGYKIQRDEARLMEDAVSAEQAGAFAVVVECIPAHIAAQITRRLTIPTIGIGAGQDCDGQVLVIHDLLGLTSGYVPRFVRQYTDLGQTIKSAVRSYCDDVRDGRFPAPEETHE
jgi:3-methyl-2-oxobutanoate hydroxymethyltransferase